MSWTHEIAPTGPRALLRWRPLVSLIGLLAIHVPSLSGTVSVGVAWADPPPPDSDELLAAKEHFKRGRSHQTASEWDAAIAEYQAGFVLVASPEFLFNIAQCYRLKGDVEKAIDFYQRYVRLAPDGKGAAEAIEHIDALRVHLPSRPATPPAPVTLRPGAPNGTQSESSIGGMHSGTRAVKTPKKAPTPLKSYSANAPSWYSDGYGWVIVGAGAGLAVTGALLELSAMSLGRESDESLDSGLSGELRESAETREVVALVTGGVGVAIVVAGIAKLALREPVQKDTSVHFVATPTPGGAILGLSLSGF